MSRWVTVYKSRRVANLYIYVDRDEGLKRVPDELKARLGVLEEALQIELSSGRRLARANADAVLGAIEEAGYYVQLPPPPERADWS